jgi:hypothetical protein
MEYDETKAIEFIRQSTEHMLDEYDDDQILNVIDIVWDWQEENGFLDIDADPGDDEIDTSKVTEYAIRLLAKDKGATLRPEVVGPIVEAELKYEEQL